MVNRPRDDYESETVHRARRHPRTRLFGSWGTPTEDVSTVCRVAWKARPRRTFNPELVTCSACKVLAPSLPGHELSTWE
jgi:hypothetical protein